MKDIEKGGKKIRQFNSGATRDSNDGKFDYEGFNHPLVDEAYGRYMHKHRKQADGKLRDSDNWQKLFGPKHCAVCIKSLMRHLLDLRFLHRGYKRTDEKSGLEVTEEEALCAIIFNANAYLFKILTDDLKGK